MNSDESKEQSPDRSTLRRIGAIVCALGLVQLVYGIANAPKGMVRLEGFGLIVGLLILFGNYRVIAVVRWLALLTSGMLILEPIKPFVLLPSELTLVQLRLYPMAAATLYAPAFLSVAIVLTAAVGLSRRPVLAALAEAGRKVRSAHVPLALGLILAFGFSFLQYRILTGETARHASALAAERYGPKYKYYTNSVTVQYGAGERAEATVQAWNANEVLTIPVEWKH